jgi:hypothetical protein
MGRPKKIFNADDPLAIAHFLPPDEKEYYLTHVRELNQNYPEQNAQALKSQSAFLALQSYRLMKENERRVSEREKRRHRLIRISALITRAEKYLDVLIKDYKMPKLIPTPAQEASLFLGNLKRQNVGLSQPEDDNDLSLFERCLDIFDSEEYRNLINKDLTSLAKVQVKKDFS